MHGVGDNENDGENGRLLTKFEDLCLEDLRFLFRSATLGFGYFSLRDFGFANVGPSL